MFRIESTSTRIMVVNEEQQDNQLSELKMKNAWPSRSKEMKELLLNKEMKELKIERAEHKRRIEQLEDQNDDLLLELASLRMNKSVSSVRSELYDGGESESVFENSFSVITTANNNDEQKEVGSDGNNNSKDNSNSNAAIPRRNSDAITFTRSSPHGNRRATIGVTTPKAIKSCFSTQSTLRRGCSSDTHMASRRGSRRVTIGGSSPYSANDLTGSGSGSGGINSTNSTARRRISSSSKDLLRICKGFVLLDDDEDDEAPSSGGDRNSKW